MAQDNNTLQRMLADFELLLVNATEVLRAGEHRPALLDAYDDACDRLIAGLRRDDIPEERLQSIHKTVARLRLALEKRRFPK